MTAESAGSQQEAPTNLLSRLRRARVARKLAFVLAAAALVSGVATYVELTRSTPFGPDPDTILVLLYIDLVLLLLLGTVVARRIVQVWVERRRGSAGSRLHVRLVVLFSLVAVTPAIVVAVASVLFLNFGIQSWFSDRVRTALSESLAVAQAYLSEHQKNIRADILAMAYAVEQESPVVIGDPNLLSRLLRAHAAVRTLPEAIIFDGTGLVLASSGLSFALEFDPVPAWALEKARAGDVAIMIADSGDRVRALVRVNRLDEMFLYVGRFVDSGVLNHVQRTREAVEEYERLEGTRSGLQINFAMMFAVLSLLLLLAAIWVGLMFATQLTRPVSALIAAAERARAGDLSARVPELPERDEIGTLSRAFNRMTSQLETHQGELMEANQQLDTRRRFTEAVLAGVSAGVIGLDEDGRINLPNRTASLLLSIDLEAQIGRPLGAAVPEMADLVKAARRRPRGHVEARIKIGPGGQSRTLLARVTVERGEQEILGYVVTFDDITALQSAQRIAAWADVARRIAHEIKNPLTPIQLSAERLKRKYLKEIESDPQTFENLTDTIVRQVGDIGRMVDEFSAFARMPAPVMKTENLVDVCRQALILQRTGNPAILYEAMLPDHAVTLDCDSRQIGQALTNLLQNAADSIGARTANDGDEPSRGWIQLAIVQEADVIAVEVSDNGIGLPVQERHQLTEPYVTTRTKGTGLGLAIVKKIMEDHGGDLSLDDREDGGAVIRLVFNTPDVTDARQSESADGTRDLEKTA